MIIFLKDLAGNTTKLDYCNFSDISVLKLKNDLYKKNYDVKLFLFFQELNDNDSVKDGDMIDVFYEKNEFALNEIEKYEKSLFYCLGSHKKIKLLKKSLIENKAIIAGDSILRFINDTDDSNENELDEYEKIDIYINYSNGHSFIDSLKNIGFEIGYLNIDKKEINMNEVYKKNKVMSYFVLECKKINIKVFILPDYCNLEKLVYNFDFSFCQIWYDGIKIQSHDITDVRKKEGVLNKDYVDCLYKDLNLVLIDRIKRYTKEGYKINIDFFLKNMSYCYTHNDDEKNEMVGVEDVLFGLSVFVYKQTRNREFIIAPFDKNNYNKLFFKIFMKEYNKEEYIKKWGQNFFNFWCRLYYNYNKDIMYINSEFMSEKIDLFNIFNFKLQWFSYLS